MKNPLLHRLLPGLLCLGLALLPAFALAADKVKVAIGQKGLWDTMITVMAIDEGFFAKEGLEVEITWTRGGAETLQAVITGSVDFAFANGVLGVIGAYAKGAPVRIVSAQMTGAPDLYWYAKSDSGIKTLADANGKSMGYSRPGSSTNLVALALAKHYKVKPKLVSSGGISGTRTQVMSNQVDIGWSVPPFNLDLVADGSIHIVARGSDVPSLVGQTVRVNVANAEFLKSRRDVAKRFMKVYAQTIDWMYTNQDASVKRYAEANKIDLAVAKSALAFYPRSGMNVAPISGFDQSMQEAIENKRLTAPLSAAQQKELIDIVYTP